MRGNWMLPRRILPSHPDEARGIHRDAQVDEPGGVDWELNSFGKFEQGNDSSPRRVKDLDQIVFASVTFTRRTVATLLR